MPGCRHDVDEKCALLSSQVACSGNYSPTLRHNLSLPSSKVTIKRCCEARHVSIYSGHGGCNEIHFAITFYLCTSKLFVYFPFKYCIYTLLLLLLLPGAELSLIAKSFGLLNDLLLPFLSILDASCPISDLHLANALFDVILPSVLGSSL
jgi:hypothetical protein